MAEIPNVIGGEVITSEWGNDIRDRAVMRYANTAARTASHPTPTAGDLAFMEDSGDVYRYFAGAWTLARGVSEVAGSTAITSSTFGTSPAAEVTVTLNIPTTWASWQGYATAMGTFTYMLGADTVTFLIRVDGTDRQPIILGGGGTVAVGIALQGHRTGMTTTGNRAFDLIVNSTSGTGTVNNMTLYAHALRTT